MGKSLPIERSPHGPPEVVENWLPVTLNCQLWLWVVYLLWWYPTDSMVHGDHSLGEMLEVIEGGSFSETLETFLRPFTGSPRTTGWEPAAYAKEREMQLSSVLKPERLGVFPMFEAHECAWVSPVNLRAGHSRKPWMLPRLALHMCRTSLGVTAWRCSAAMERMLYQVRMEDSPLPSVAIRWTPQPEWLP